MPKKKRTAILIPSARYVDRKMQLEVGKVPPVLIRVNGKLVLEMIVERYAPLGDGVDFILSIDQGEALVREQVSRSYVNHKIQIVKVDSNKCLGSSILEVLDSIDSSKYKEIIINFGDTLIGSDFNHNRSAIYYKDLRESYRWTTFLCNGGRISEITDKFHSDILYANHVFTGVFKFHNPQELYKALKEAEPLENLDLFYSALLNYLNKNKYDLVEVEEWEDFGHADNYYSAKKKFLNKRFFNQLKIDEHHAIVRKTSKHVDKFIGEVRWYLELPSALRCYIPQIHEYCLDRNNTFVEMEYYGYPNLSDIYLWNGYDLGIWTYAFDTLFRLIEEMKKHQMHESSEKKRQILEIIYLEKTFKRLLSIKEEALFEPFFEQDIIINDKIYHSIDYYLKHLKDLCEHCGIFDLDYLSVIHGDLCLSNILYDPKHRIIKLVDPRGKFGRHTIYGDYRYELAKLSHSFNGHYESIVNDCFTLFCEDTSISYKPYLSKNQAKITSLFNARMDVMYARQGPAIALIESLLFLSMISFHADHPNRQLAMLATGVPKIHKALLKVKEHTQSHRV